VHIENKIKLWYIILVEKASIDKPLRSDLLYERKI